MLEVRLIGKFDIQCDGSPVVLSSRAAQSLFAFLILTAGTLHRREKLAGMLWPDESEQKARTYLRNELWRIRKALSQTSSVEYLLADNLTLGFNQSSPYWLDTAGLKDLSDKGSADELIQSLSNYQGDLLPGFYEDWVVSEREHLQVLFEKKIACLLEMLEKAQRWQDILEWAERWITLGQAPEAAYRSLMTAYDALGDHANVTSTYERCKQALRQLDLEPSEQTRALAFKRNSKIKVPIPLTSFVGRDQELKEVAGLFSKSRLITLTGSGGVGKTRLAIQVVADVLELFPDGVWFLDLAPLTDPALVPQLILTTLGLIEQAGRSPVAILTDFLQTRSALLIMDNCEHLIQACSQLAETLLLACPTLHILTTSRETLRVAGEFPYRVPSLEIPRPDIESDIDSLAKVEAVRLFTERAAVVSPGFAVGPQNVLIVAQICQRLDGIPLAIELAAARMSMLSSQQILKRLDDRFNLLTSGLRTSLPRHQTLRATIDWSYTLLSSQEQLLFERLSVFSGGWTLEAGESVCGGEGIEKHEILNLLTELLNKSLILADRKQGTEMRYRMLETIRQYARTKLSQASEGQMLHQRHLAYFVDLAERAEPNLRAFDMLMWLDWLESEIDNIRLALANAQESAIEAQLRLASALLWFWHIRGHKNEGVDWLDRGLSVEATELGDQSPTSNRAMIRGKALYVAGFLRLMLAETDKGAMLSEESLTLFQGLGTSGRRGMAYALWNLAVVAGNQGNFHQEKALFEQCLDLFQEMGDKFGVAQCMDSLGYCVAFDEGDYETGKILLEDHLALRQEIGDLDGIALAYLALGHLALHQYNFKQATIHYESSLPLFREAGNRWAMSKALSCLGAVAKAVGTYRRATTVLEEALVLDQEMGDKHEIAIRLNELGLVAQSEGNYDRATQMHEQALILFHEVGNQFDVSNALCNIGFAALAQADYTKAIKFSEEALAINKEAENHFNTALALYCIGRVEQSRGDLTLARKLNLEALTIFQDVASRTGKIWGAARCLEAFASLAVKQKQMKQATFLFSISGHLYFPLRFEMSARERVEHDQAIAAARGTLSEEVFSAAWEEGQQVSLDEAVTYALKELQ